MNIYISSDHGGFELKEYIEKYFDIEDHELSDKIDIVDLGPNSYDKDDDYPQYAFNLAQKVVESNGLGILLCRSGQGIAIAANKVEGVRAAIAFNPKHAIHAREHDHANILVLAADYTIESQVIQIIIDFIKSTPAEGKYQRRVDQITEYEQDN